MFLDTSEKFSCLKFLSRYLTYNRNAWNPKTFFFMSRIGYFLVKFLLKNHVQINPTGQEKINFSAGVCNKSMFAVHVYMQI